MANPYHSSVENGPAKIVVRLSLSSGHGELLYTSITKISRPIFGRSLYAAQSIPLIRDLGLFRQHGIISERQCKGKLGNGHTWVLWNAILKGSRSLIFTYCPYLPHQYSESINLTPSKILLTNLDSDLWRQKNW